MKTLKIFILLTLIGKLTYSQNDYYFTFGSPSNRFECTIQGAKKPTIQYKNDSVLFSFHSGQYTYDFLSDRFRTTIRNERTENAYTVMDHRRDGIPKYKAADLEAQGDFENNSILFLSCRNVNFSIAENYRTSIGNLVTDTASIILSPNSEASFSGNANFLRVSSLNDSAVFFLVKLESEKFLLEAIRN